MILEKLFSPEHSKFLTLLFVSFGMGGAGCLLFLTVTNWEEKEYSKAKFNGSLFIVVAAFTAICLTLIQMEF